MHTDLHPQDLAKACSSSWLCRRMQMRKKPVMGTAAPAVHVMTDPYKKSREPISFWSDFDHRILCLRAPDFPVPTVQLHVHRAAKIPAFRKSPGPTAFQGEIWGPEKSFLSTCSSLEDPSTRSSVTQLFTFILTKERVLERINSRVIFHYRRVLPDTAF